MTPTSSAPRSSGNPAKQADINLSVKQQREQRKQEKLAEYQRELDKRKRTKLVWWGLGGVAAAAIVALVVVSVVTAPAPRPVFSAGSDGAEIDGVETFTHVTTHTDDDVTYEQTPPAGGAHSNAWLNCGIYLEPQKDENAVHSMEHGAVWVTYDPSKVSGDAYEELQRQMPSSYVILSPFEGMDSPITLSAWNTQLKVDAVDDERIGDFFEEYWRSQNVPEPNALCSGAIEGPGRA